MATLAAIWAGLLALYLAVGASPFILGFLALFTLPLAVDVATNPTARFEMTVSVIAWENRQQDISVELSRIEQVTIVTSLDLSLRVVLALEDGQKLRVPPDCTPQISAFRRACDASGLIVTRRHFTLLS
ncbi:MAG: hypothetical protein AAFO93_13970 [Pseudomonadota bacterium]